MEFAPHFPLLALLLALAAHCAQAQEEGYVPGRLLVRFKPGALSRQAIPGMQLQREVGDRSTKVFQITDGTSVQDKLAELRGMTNLELAEPDYEVSVNASVVPNDPQYEQQWHLPRISAPAAWKVTRGSKAIKVCIIDTGVSPHPDLAGKVVKGFNLLSDQPSWDYSDRMGHGTHVAGLLAAAGNNRLGVAGVAWDVALVVCRFLNAQGKGAISDAVECTKLCRQEGALITSNSYTSRTFSQALYDEIQGSSQAQAATSPGGLLVVAAAGNSQKDLDQHPEYPAAIPLGNVVSVAATDRDDWLAYFSNYARRSVDLAAPGSKLLSTARGSGYVSYSGTSMACPLVAGAAVLIQATAMAAGVTLTPLQIKQHLLKGVDRPRSGQSYKLAGLSVTGGRLNVARALQSVMASMSGSFTIKQSILTWVPYDCPEWAPRSWDAYRAAAAALAGLDPSQLAFSCQQAGRGRLRIVLTGRTGRVTIKAAWGASRQLNAAVGSGEFKRRVLQLAPGAAPPGGSDAACVEGLAGCEEAGTRRGLGERTGRGRGLTASGEGRDAGQFAG